MSILKEEKRQLTEQLNAKRICGNSQDEAAANEFHPPTTSPTTTARKEIPGDLSSAVDWLSDPRLLSTASGARGFLAGSTRSSAPPIPRKPLRSVGVGDGNVFAKDLSTTTSGGVAACNGFDGATPIRMHERELNTQEHTELRERETKTLFLGGGGPSWSPESLFPLSPRTGRPERPTVPPKPKVTRTARVGTDTDFPSPTNSFEVHEKELRTLYIEDSSPRETRSTRNVGIQCRSAMRDVGVMHLSECERPMTRSIGVGVGEIGVSDGDGGGYSGQMSRNGGHMVSTSSSSRLFTSSAESKRIHIRDDQLRSVLEEMLRFEFFLNFS